MTTRWGYIKLADEWMWRTEQILKMRGGGTTVEDEAPLRAEIDALFVRAGWTQAEFDRQLDKRVDRYFAKEDRAKARATRGAE